MAAYVHEDPINIKFILDYIKTNHGDTAYNTVLTYKGGSGATRSVDMSLQELMTYANQHYGNIPINFEVTLLIEYDNSNNMTGNFIIDVIQIYNNEFNNTAYRPLHTTFLNTSRNKLYFCSNWYYNNRQSKWLSGPEAGYKCISMGCSGTSSTKTIVYCQPNGGIASGALSNFPNFTISLTTSEGAKSCYGGVPAWNQESSTVKLWSTAIWYRSNTNNASGKPPLILADKGSSYYGDYNLTPSEEQYYIDYKAPLILIEEVQPYDGINCFDLSFNGMTYVAERHQHEAGMFVRLLDEVSTHSKVIFTNETIGKAYDQVSYAKPILIPDEVFEKPGLIRADVYGTGTSASTVQKQFYFKVKENPSTRTTLSNLTMGTNIKPFRVRNSNRIEFLWAHTGSSNPAIEIIDDDMMVKCMDIWNDSNPNVKYQISPTNNKFPIPLSYFDLKGTFHGLLRCGNNKVDSVVTEFIWNFE